MNNSQKKTATKRCRCSILLYTVPLSIAALLLCLSACNRSIKEPSVSWGPVFMDHFHPTQALTAEMKDGFQSIDMTSKGKNTEVRLTQSLGDSLTMCLAVDVYFAEDAFGMISKEATAETFSVLPQTVYLLPGSADEIPTEEEMQGNRSMDAVNGISVLTSGIDTEKRMLSYFVRFQTNRDILYTGETATLVLGHFVMDGAGKNQVLSEDMHALPFHYLYTTKKVDVSFDHADKGLKGHAIVTPLSLIVSFDTSPYTTWEEAAKAVKVISKKDTTLGGEMSVGGDINETNKNGVVRKAFGEILDLNDVKEILVGGVTCKVS